MHNDTKDLLSIPCGVPSVEIPAYMHALCKKGVLCAVGSVLDDVCTYVAT